MIFPDEVIPYIGMIPRNYLSDKCCLIVAFLVAYCAGFRTPACGDYRRALAAGLRKAPRQEIAVGSSAAVRRALWGFSRGAGLEEVGEKRLSRSGCCKSRMSASG
jgi:hypothetical protein